MNVNWGTCGGSGIWCGFRTVDLTHPTFEKEGVYIIWQKGGNILRVGKGRLRDKITEDRKSPVFPTSNNLLITWTEISSQHRSGVEKYIVEQLNPVVANELTGAAPVPVNLPWPYK